MRKKCKVITIPSFLRRYKLPVIIIIVNNNGIYSGFDNETFRQLQASGDPTQVYVSLQSYNNIKYQKLDYYLILL